MEGATGAPEGKKGFAKGKKPEVSFPLGYVIAMPNAASRSQARRLEISNMFGYDWVRSNRALDQCAVRR